MSQSSPSTPDLPSAVHPGAFVRESVLAPKKLSVQAAAKLLGVGRPALSNFVNGHVAATPEMASRIELAFGIPAQQLLDLQAAYDAAQFKAKGTPTTARAYVPPFLSMKAKDIESWVDRNIPARIRLPVLLRTLVNSTGIGLKTVDFPANDDAERAGWDGYVDASDGTPWIPTGVSGWEFGTNQDIKSKADGDFAKSVRALEQADRVRITFVFVTPRHWPGKADWVKQQRKKRLWRDVRAYDSSDLEQWLEQSIAAQTWLANENDRPSGGVRSLDKCWADWAAAADPPLAGSLFGPAIENAWRTLVARLGTQTAEPIVIAADSVDEALAFLAQVFGPAGGAKLEKYRDSVLIFDEPGVITKVIQGTTALICVATNREVESELAPLARSTRTIVIHPRNAANTEPDVVLQPLTYDAFRASLEKMGHGHDDIAKYDRESGRSLTVLRRRLSKMPAVRTPEWAADDEAASSLVPFTLVGAWNSNNPADQTVLTLLAGEEPYDELEKRCRRLVKLSDPPLWSVGPYRGVVSKIDSLYAIADSVTKRDLERYFEVARLVLGEDDPSLDLPDEDRWSASIHGKTREISGVSRQGISETLVILAVHGNRLFLTRLGFDCELATRHLVRELLSPVTTRTLEANDRDLPAYAEAAPDVFLSILEDDLRRQHPEVYGLLRPAASGVFGAACPRTGLLWGLEGLAWNPSLLTRAALVLAQLSEIEIKDNWTNKPIGSLQAIFRVWMPQTAADHNARLGVLKLLLERFPEVAWKICLEQLETGRHVGHYSHKPVWRNDGYGFGEPFRNPRPVVEFMRDIAQIVLSWKKGYTRDMVCDLIRRLHGFDASYQSDIWALVKTWASTASDADKGVVRESIRVTVLSRRGARRSRRAGFAGLRAAASEAYRALEPSDLLSKHAWLFREQWVEESADDLQEEDFDFRKHDERVIAHRKTALREILTERGLDGIFALAEMGKAAGEIGWLMVRDVLPEGELANFVLAALTSADQNEFGARSQLVVGALRGFPDDESRIAILKVCKERLKESDFVRLLLLAPFRRGIWLLVDELAVPERDAYWRDVVPELIRETDDENAEAVERLLAAERPRAAFACVRYKLEAVEPELLFRLMTDILEGGKETHGQYRLDPHSVEEAFQLIDDSAAVTLDQKASLEFSYIDVLTSIGGRSNYGIPNLERFVERNPDLVVQALVWAYKRADGGEDPPDLKAPADATDGFATRGYTLLQALRRIPGHDDFGELSADALALWVKTVRDSARELGRLDSADRCIGRLLASAPVGADGLWPEPVRQVMEDCHSKRMMEGAHERLYNDRGVVQRGEGGDQERELANKYRGLGNALQYSHPFLASELLLRIAETYEREATREDIEADIQVRLR